MSCCTASSTGKVFSESAGYYAWKFRHRGLDRVQRMLARALRDVDLASKSILEVGCGVGALHLTLLMDGAASAFGIDVSEGMLAKAREMAAEMGLEARTAYQAGDFAASDGSIPRSDIVILDKVVCCYADPETLLGKSAGKCSHVLAVSYPRDGWISRWLFRSYEVAGKLMNWKFHPFYHEPSRLEGATRSHGFEEVFSGKTIIWQVKVYERTR